MAWAVAWAAAWAAECSTCRPRKWTTSTRSRWGPAKSASYKIATVCLEHGKRDPRPAIPYEIRPLETVTTKPGVAEVLTLLGYGKIDQREAQAAAWHLANGMSWEQLAQKRVQTVLGDGGSYFTPDQISSGVQCRGSRGNRGCKPIAPEAAAEHEEPRRCRRLRRRSTCAPPGAVRCPLRGRSARHRSRDSRVAGLCDGAPL